MAAKVIPNTSPSVTPNTSDRAEADLEAKAELFRRAFRAFAQLYKPGDFRRYPWLDEGLRTVEDQADGLSVEAIRGRLRELYLRFKRAKAGK